MSAHKDVNGRENVHCTTHLDGHFAPGMVFGAIGARPYFRPIKPAPSAQSANTATAMSSQRHERSKNQMSHLASSQRERASTPSLKIAREEISKSLRFSAIGARQTCRPASTGRVNALILQKGHGE